MKRQLDADGYDIGEESEGRGSRLPVILVGVGSALVITASVGLVAYTLTRPPGGSEHTARAAEATVKTALGHTVRGDKAAVQTALPAARGALDGTLGAPPGLQAGGKDVIPERVLQSYTLAESRLASESQGCHLPWWLLAGIGKVQSNHAASGQVDSAGTATVRIVGPRLDGNIAGGEMIRDTDQGALDGDLSFDRGVGPMLLVPQTWQTIGRDGNGDGKSDVSNADDAALAVGTLLCSADTDVSTAEGLASALVKVDDSATFPGDILPWAAYYRGSIVPEPTASSHTPTPSSAAPTPGVTPPPASSPSTASAAPTTPPPSGPGFTTQPTTAPPSTTPPTVAPRPTARPTTPRPTTPRPTTPAPRPTAPRPPAPRPTLTPAPRPTTARPTAPPRPTQPSRTPTSTPSERPTTPAPTHSATDTPAPEEPTHTPREPGSGSSTRTPPADLTPTPPPSTRTRADDSVTPATHTGSGSVVDLR